MSSHHVTVHQLFADRGGAYLNVTGGPSLVGVSTVITAAAPTVLVTAGWHLIVLNFTDREALEDWAASNQHRGGQAFEVSLVDGQILMKRVERPAVEGGADA